MQHGLSTGKSIHTTVCELCSAQPESLIQRPWAFCLPQWKCLHNYHIPLDLFSLISLARSPIVLCVVQSFAYENKGIYLKCFLIINFPDMLSSSTWRNARYLHFNGLTPTPYFTPKEDLKPYNKCSGVSSSINCPLQPHNYDAKLNCISYPKWN